LRRTLVRQYFYSAIRREFKRLQKKDIFPLTLVNPVCEVSVEKHKKVSVPKLGNTNFHPQI